MATFLAVIDEGSGLARPVVDVDIITLGNQLAAVETLAYGATPSSSIYRIASYEVTDLGSNNYRFAMSLNRANPDQAINVSVRVYNSGTVSKPTGGTDISLLGTSTAILEVATGEQNILFDVNATGAFFVEVTPDGGISTLISSAVAV